MDRKRYGEKAAWALVVVASLFVLARLGTALPVAAQTGVHVVGTPTPTATSVAPVVDGIMNPSFETGDFSGWIVDTGGEGDLPSPVIWDGEGSIIVGQGDGEPPQSAWGPSDGAYCAMVPWLGCGPGVIRIMQDVTLPAGPRILLFDYRAVWALMGEYNSAPVAPLGFLPVADRAFDLVIQAAGGGGELARHRILTLPGGTVVPAGETLDDVPPQEDTGLMVGAVDLSDYAGQTVRLVFEWSVPDCRPYLAIAMLDNVRLVRPGDHTRTDVSVIVYGGWNDIPARLWVGGTEQETLYTATNAFGDAQAMWTLYPTGAWPVTVDVQLPAGLDPDQWELKLVRVSSPTLGWTNDEPGAAAATIMAGQQVQFVYQLVSK